MMPKNLDPKNIGSRLYNQVDVLLDQLERSEHVTIKERYMALAAIARIQAIFQAIRIKDGSTDEPATGSAVRKYSTAFASHDTRRRKARSGATGFDPDLANLIGDDDDDERGHAS